MNDNDTSTRPIGHWITAIDRLLKAEFATVFEDEGITRRDWRLLNHIAGTSPASAAPDRPLNAHRLRRLIGHGWIERTREGWALTETGSLAKQRLGTAVDEIRTRVAGAVSPEGYTALMESLESIARALGWEEGRPLPRREPRHRGRHGHRGHGHGHESHGHHGHFDHLGHRDRRHHDHDHGHSHTGHGNLGHGHCGHSRHWHSHCDHFAGHTAPAPHIHLHQHG